VWTRKQIVNPWTELGIVEPSDSMERGERLRVLDVLANYINTCTKCYLGTIRDPEKILPLYMGNPEAKIMLVGKAPAYHELRTGKLFAGKSGDELAWFLNMAGLAEYGIYICNACCCRAINDGQLKTKQIKSCRAHLLMQIDVVQPDFIVAMGDAAAHALLGKKMRVGEERGKVFEKYGAKLIVTYHPALYTRSTVEVEERNKEEGLKDWVFLKELIDGKDNSDAEPAGTAD